MRLDEQIERFRKKLLDLTNRNRLLNLRRGSRTITIVDELPDQIYQRLVVAQKSFAFLPSADDQSALSAELALPQGIGVTAHARHRDDKLQTQLNDEKLGRALAAIRTDANSFIQETGINHLFVSIGMLRWFESRDSERHHDAPLLLIPVQLGREFSPREGHYVYPLSWSGEEVQFNPCLQMKLDREFEMRLPEFEDEASPDEYLARIRSAVKSEARWEVRREAVLAFFSFTKLLMYRDLDPRNWPAGGGLMDHPLLTQLFGGGPELNEASANDRPTLFANDYDIDRRAVEDEVQLIDNADSSQHSALIDIADGKTLVIEGPPGTGKSQTITNAIGGALAAGKTVLFVSEKLAALEVVQKRLTGLGLGQLCLELHSNKAKPKDLYDGLRLRLEARFERPESMAREEAQLRTEQERLRAYLNATEVCVGPYHEPLYDVFWKVVELRGRGLRPLAGAKVNVEWNHAQLQDRLTYFETVHRHLVEVGTPATPRWKGFHCPRYRVFDRQAVADAFADLVAGISELETETRRFKDRGITWVMLPNDSAVAAIGAQDGAVIPAEPFATHAAITLLTDRDAYAHLDEFLRVLTYHTDARHRAELVCRGGNIREQVSLAQQLVGEIERWFGDSSMTVGGLGELAVLTGNAIRTLSEVAGFATNLTALGHGNVRSPREYLSSVERHRLMTDAVIGNGSHLAPEHFFVDAGRRVMKYRAHSDVLAKERVRLEEAFIVSDIPPDTDFAALRRNLRQDGTTWRRWISPGYRRTTRTIRSFLKPGVSLKPLPLADNLDKLESHLRECSRFEQDKNVQRFVGPQVFAGLATDWDRVERTVVWAERARAIGIDFDEAKRLCGLVNEGEPQATPDTLVGAAKVLGKQLAAELLRPFIADLHQQGPTVLFERLRKRLDELAESIACLRQGLDSFEVSASTRLSDVRALLQSVIAADSLRAQIDDDVRFRAVAGPNFAGAETEVEPLRRALAWSRLLDQLGVPAQVKAWLAQTDPLSSASVLQQSARNALQASKRWRGAVSTLCQYGKIDEDWLLGPVGPAKGNGGTPHHECIRQITSLVASLDELGAWSDWCRILDRGSQLDVIPFVEAVVAGKVDAANLRAVFELSFFEALSQAVVRRSDVLTNFSRQQLEQARSRYQQLDEKLLVLNRQRIAHDASRRPVPRGIGTGRVSELTQLSLILHEVSKQHRHCRIRQLVGRAGAAMQALKPCFMMSPLSVAHFLPPGSIKFDLVIMDEASQVKPADALGAIVRGEQAVVVGDPKQLPPTTFWDLVDDEEIPDDEQTIADETESILEVAMKAFPNPRRLKWHYRSRHESLIAFSNDRFYDGDLVVFPSPSREQVSLDGEGRLGVFFRRIAGGTYKPKQGNLVEANAVASAVVQHALTTPTVSLGVGTFNIHQRDLIERCLDERCSQDSRVRDAVDALRQSREALFVKNLENLQGDERDVMFISYSFAPEQEGGRVMQRFGPIAQATGWRRLNVLITRGRRRVEVFSSIDAEAIVGGHERSLGVNSMKDYLDFATRGMMADRGDTKTGREPGSPFEIAVMRAVERHSLKVVPQVGVAGYFIDIGVLRPGRDDEFLLGIECDGAAYHSAKSTRDRDRLREQVIRDRGWQLHRIWSTDWYYNQQAEEARLAEVVARLLSGKA